MNISRLLIHIALFSSLGLLFVTPPQSDAEDLKTYDLSLESLGGVQIGAKYEQVKSRLGKARSMTKPMTDFKNKCEKRVLYYDTDLEVELCSKNNIDVVHSLRVIKNNAVSTAKGARTGMSLKQIKQIYPKATTINDHTVIVKDQRTHLRLRFLLSNQTVYEISLYREKRLDKPKTKVRSNRSKLMNF